MNISFILGAGFSALDNYPTRNELNNRLRKISHDEIWIHTDGTAFFLSDKDIPNAEFTKRNEKLFVERFLEFYSTQIIDSFESFDYEVFFDYYQAIHKGRHECEKFNSFANAFRIDNNSKIDNLNLLNNFHSTFNQLLAGQLMRKPARVHLAKYYTKYPDFLNYIDEISPLYEKIHIHTLNHDLLLEELSASDAMQNELSDGFTDIGSPYFSKTYKDGHTVRLSRFTNKYDKKFCLYKLHGSIDYYVYNFMNEIFELVKVPYGVSSTQLMKEYTDKDGELKLHKCFWNYYPEFLSGTTEKIFSYGGLFYKPFFDHLIENLMHTDTLISIGYGLGDRMINELIVENFLSNPTKKMIVIALNKPDSEIFDYENVIYYGEGMGVQDINKGLIDILID